MSYFYIYHASVASFKTDPALSGSAHEHQIPRLIMARLMTIHSSNFFSDKIERIRSKFSPSDSPDPFLFPIIPPPNLSNFNPTTFSEIRNLIFSSQNKQCELDSIPTFLLKLCFDELGPTITIIS